jgi:cytochrome P450
MNEMTPVDFTDRVTQGCPFAAYEALRSQSGVYLEPQTGFYSILDYALVKRLAADTEHMSMRAGLIGERDDPHARMGEAIIAENGVRMIDVLVSGDPPDHSFHRSLIDKVFSTRRVKGMEDFLREVVDRRIDGFIDRGTANFHTEFAIPVPLIIIASQLGLSVDALDIKRFREWSDAFGKRAEPGQDLETTLATSRSLAELHHYVLNKAEEYARVPADVVLSDLVHANINGRKLDKDELISIVTVFLSAGNETTTSAISNMIIQLIDEPGLEHRLRDDAALIPAFIEEVLRLQSPVQALFRRARVDIEVDGVMIPAGSVLVLRWGAANRDPKKFENPAQFDITRPNSRQHITFGFGPHFCVGNQLARNEMRISVERLLKRMKNFRYGDVTPTVTREPHFSTFGLRDVHIAFDRNDAEQASA